MFVLENVYLSGIKMYEVVAPADMKDSTTTKRFYSEFDSQNRHTYCQQKQESFTNNSRGVVDW